MRKLFIFGGLWALFASSMSAQEKKLDRKHVELFELKIRPVLAQHCYRCHSVDAEKNKKLRGGLYLDSRAGVLKGGDSGPAIVAGKSKESLLLKALKHDSDELKMPPKGKLPSEVIADFARWIDMGAPDPRVGGEKVAKKQIDVEAGRKHWAFAALGKPVVPSVKNNPWARNPVDRFILSRLDEKRLSPNGPASKEKLIRRAYYDLLGLPPTPTEIEAFVRDGRPDAYELLIDKLLQSEHYGERWARHWLDIVRFAESSGYEFDGDRPNAYHYRDFVIRAFNQDMPYDQFVRWQVSGDYVEPRSLPAAAATGFLVAGPYPGQTTAKTLALIRYNHLDDMVSTLGSALLGVSVGCARCHEHKYDPIPQEDYYRLVACLARTDSTNAKIDPEPEITQKAKAAFDAVHNPLVSVRDKFDKERLPAKLKAAVELVKNPAPVWLTVEKAIDSQSKPATTKAVKDKGGVFNTSVIVARTYLKNITAIRVESTTTKFVPVELNITAASVNGKTKEAPLKMQPHKFAADAVAMAVVDTQGNNGFDGGTVLKLALKFKGDPATAFKFSITTAPRPIKLDGLTTPQRQGELAALLASEKGMLMPKNREGVLHWLRVADPEMDKIYRAVEESAKNAPMPKYVTIFAADGNKGGDVHFLIRGEVDKKGPLAKPGFVQVMMHNSDQEKRWIDKPKATVPPRVALADWLTDPEQGAGNLLARVIVNRLWQHHFGRGIVGTPNDFGVQGDAPTHPELLDYLAHTLIKSGWKLKPLHKLIMTSAAYMQDGAVIPANMQTDPQNLLWWRRPARRLEAEAIRDALLAVSGTLDKTMFGAGTLDANNPRRSVYLRVKRSQMVPFMQMFDAPEAQQSIGARTITTVATQSLAFMNSPLVRRSAEKLAQRIAAGMNPKSPDRLSRAIDEAYLFALGRVPTAPERTRMQLFIETQAVSYGATPKSLNQALTDFCHVVLCLNEFIYVD